jgi:hypothetical protein
MYTLNLDGEAYLQADAVIADRGGPEARTQVSMFATQELSRHLQTLHNLSNVNEGNAPAKLESVISGLATCTELLAIATAKTSSAKRALNIVESAIFFGEYEEYCKAKGKKPTSAEGERFVYTQELYLKAKEEFDRAEAERLYFEGLRVSFDRAIGAIRSIVYGKTNITSV